MSKHNAAYYLGILVLWDLRYCDVIDKSRWNRNSFVVGKKGIERLLYDQFDTGEYSCDEEFVLISVENPTQTYLTSADYIMNL